MDTTFPLILLSQISDVHLLVTRSNNCCIFQMTFDAMLSRLALIKFDIFGVYIAFVKINRSLLKLQVVKRQTGDILDLFL